MSGFGNRIIQSPSKPVYPFYKPSSVQNTPNVNQSFQYAPKTPSPFVYTKIEDKIEKLTNQLDYRDMRNQDQKLAQSFISLVSNFEQHAQSPVIAKPKTPQQPEMGALFSSLQRQQELILKMMENMQVKKEIKDRKQPKYKIPNQQITMPGMQNPNSMLVEEQYQRVKANPFEFKRILAELNFDDDEAEKYADAERKFKYDPNLTDEEKAKILLKMAHDKRQREYDSRVVGLKGKSLFRAAGLAVLFPIMTCSSMLEKKGRLKAENIKNMEDAIKIYMEAAKGWVLKSIKAPLTSILNDQKLDLGLSSKDNTSKESEALKAKILKIQVRVKGILDGLIENTNEVNMPVPLRIFIDKLIDDGAYVPQSYFTPFERSRLDVDQFGALWRQNEDKRRLLVTMFFISRIVVKGYCLDPQGQGLPVKQNSKTQQ